MVNDITNEDSRWLAEFMAICQHFPAIAVYNSTLIILKTPDMPPKIHALTT
jgi:hypothetical protein